MQCRGPSFHPLYIWFNRSAEGSRPHLRGYITYAIPIQTVFDLREMMFTRVADVGWIMAIHTSFTDL